MSNGSFNPVDKLTIEREQCKEKIKEIFKISGDKPITIAINGKWGVGKSYFWKNEVAPLLAKEFKKYPIYTSVFGKKDENEIIKDLISQFLTKENKNVDSIKDFIHGTLKLFGKNIDTDLLFKFFKKEHMNNTIVCIDDFERLSDKIPVQDILGLISELKENKECSVVVIFNEDELFKDDESNQPNNNQTKSGKTKNKILFEKYKEKIFDFQIQFTPSAIEQFGIFTPKGLDKNFNAYQYFPDVINIDRLLQSHHSINLRELNKTNCTYQTLLHFFSLEEYPSEEFKKIYNYLFYPIAYAYHFGLQQAYFETKYVTINIDLFSPHASMYSELLSNLLSNLKTVFDFMQKTGFLAHSQTFLNPNGYVTIQQCKFFLQNFVNKIIADTTLHMEYIKEWDQKTTLKKNSINFFLKHKDDISSIPYMFGYRILSYAFDDEKYPFKKTRSFALELVMEEYKKEVFSLFNQWCDRAYDAITTSNNHQNKITEYFWIDRGAFYFSLKDTFEKLKIPMPRNKLIVNYLKQSTE